MQIHSGDTSPTQSDTFLAGLRDKIVVVHILGLSQGLPTGTGMVPATTVTGHLIANYHDALIIEITRDSQPSGERILIYKRAIVAIETS